MKVRINVNTSSLPLDFLYQTLSAITLVRKPGKTVISRKT